MAEEAGFDIGKGAPMDYHEHERTYSGFLWLVKYGTIAVIAILVAMLMGLIVGAGVIMSVLSALIFFVVAHFALLTGDEKSMKH